MLARSLARDFVCRRLAHRRGFQTVQRWTASRGPLAVALARLVPIFPYSLLNYALGLTRVGFWTYLFWTWLAMLPGHLFYVAGGDALAQFVAGGPVPLRLVVIVLGVLLLLALLMPWARRRLREGPGGGDPDKESGKG